MVGPYKLIGMSECTIISIDFSEVNFKTEFDTD